MVTEVSEGVVTLYTRARYSPDQLPHQEDGCKCLYVVVLVTEVAVGVEWLCTEQWWCPGWQPYNWAAVIGILRVSDGCSW